ncbi:MAG: hypothetical protein ACRCVG_05580 [Methanobacteriaceae archaeon]
MKKCEENYRSLEKNIHTYKCDLRKNNIRLPFSNLIICNLIIEYIGLNSFVKLIKRNKDNLKVISCVIQNNKNNKKNNEFISSSKYSNELKILDKFHEKVDTGELVNKLNNINLNEIKRKNYQLPNNKEFIRIDFENNNL